MGNSQPSDGNDFKRICCCSLSNLEPEQNCPGRHGLNTIINKEAWYQCNTCCKKIPTDSPRIYCRTCNYDLCHGCFENGNSTTYTRQKTGLLLKKEGKQRKGKKEKREQRMDLLRKTRLRTNSTEFICLSEYLSDGSQFSMADNAKIPKEQRCPGNHALKDFRTDVNNWECDKCRAKLHLGSIMYGCRRCDYDLCRGCNCMIFIQRHQKFGIHDREDFVVDIELGPVWVIFVTGKVKWNDRGQGDQKGRINLFLVRDRKTVGVVDIFGDTPRESTEAMVSFGEEDAAFHEAIIQAQRRSDKLTVHFDDDCVQGRQPHILELTIEIGLSQCIAEYQANCRQWHIDTDTAKPFETNMKGWVCNWCLVRFPKGSTMYGCRTCNFDLCRKCFKEVSIEDLRHVPRQSRQNLYTDQKRLPSSSRGLHSHFEHLGSSSRSIYSDSRYSLSTLSSTGYCSYQN